ncbi:hypothetical protein KKF11_01035 [Patescibacteria group bacterium]|nr:hypothetical protein [Patescibacteria group bacterium]
MPLSKSQKKIINKKYPKNSVSQTAKSIGVEEDLVLKYLEKKGVKIKRNKISLEKNREVRLWGKFFKRTDLVILSLVFLSILVYINSLWGDFVSDDISTIVDNHLLGTFGYYFKVMDLHRLLHSFTYLFSKLNPFGYHLINISIHTTVVILLFYFLRN